MIIVTGAFGFIGSHLVERLVQWGEDVVAVGVAPPQEDNRHVLTKIAGSGKLEIRYQDVAKIDDMKELFTKYQPSIVYHLAAIASHRLSKQEPYKYLHNNYNTVLSVLEAARTAEPSPKIVFSSSSSVYGDNIPPLKENMQPHPKGPYALSKLLGEELCKHYTTEYGLNCIIVRYFNVVGERCRGNIVFRIFAERILRGEPLEVGGRRVDGVFRPAMRDFTYVADAVEGTIFAGEKAKGFEIFNIGFGRPVSVMKVAELMLKEFGKSLPVVEKELLPHETLVSYSDNTKARERLGWAPKIDIVEMVQRFVKWFKT
ncbi:MAG: NAD-dependent epimerase/dehydratase family protein [Candidatus Caldarchaeum sp.]